MELIGKVTHKLILMLEVKHTVNHDQDRAIIQYDNYAPIHIQTAY